MNEKVLSKRLERVAHYLPKGAFFADIGSDHAYLPSAVCVRDSTAKAIAGEINEGPYQSAIAQVKSLSLTKQISVIKGDGLAVIVGYPVKQIVIAGMGGGLIRSILTKDINLLTSVERIIVQPNIDTNVLRAWFDENNFSLCAEEIIKEDGHIYEILVADKGLEQSVYQDKELEFMFGPLLSKEKSKVFIEKWQLEQQKLARIITQIQEATVVDLKKIERFEKQIQIIEGVLQGE